MHFDPGLFVWALITFLGLLGLLAKFAFKPLRRAMDQREAAIQGALDAARHAQQEAEALTARNEAQIGQAQEEARHIISEGHRIAAAMQEEAQTRAGEEAEALVNQAREAIDRELQKGLEELKGTVANLSIRVSRQVIRGELDEKRHEELADDFIDRLKKSHAARK